MMRIKMSELIEQQKCDFGKCVQLSKTSARKQTRDEATTLVMRIHVKQHMKTEEPLTWAARGVADAARGPLPRYIDIYIYIYIGIYNYIYRYI